MSLTSSIFLENPLAAFTFGGCKKYTVRIIDMKMPINAAIKVIRERMLMSVSYLRLLGRCIKELFYRASCC